jgi:hypothetical protein
MIPALWFVTKVNNLRIPIPLFIMLPFAFALELIAFIPLLIFAIVKKEYLFLNLAFGFYLTRLFFTLTLYGRKFQVKVCDSGNKVNVAGRWLYHINRI